MGLRPDTLDFSELQTHLGGGAGALAARLFLSDPLRPNEDPAGPHVEKQRKALLQQKIGRVEGRGAESEPVVATVEVRGEQNGRIAVLAEERELSDGTGRMKQKLRRPGQGRG